jgi:MFS family permease
MATDSKKGIGIVFLTLFIDLMGFSIVFPIFPAMLDWYLPDSEPNGLLTMLIQSLGDLTHATGSSRFLVTVLFGGLLGSLYSVLQFISAPIWGQLSDRFGRRPILLWTLSGNFFSYLLWIFSGELWLFILSRFISGIMSGNLSVATATIADLTDEKQRAKGMAVIGVAFGLGFLIGPAIGGACSIINPLDSFPDAAHWGIHPFSIAALAGVCLSALNLLWVYHKFTETRPKQPDQTIEPLSLNPFTRLLFSSRNIHFVSITAISFWFMLCFSGMEFTLTFLATERFNYTAAQNTRIFLFSGIVLLITQGLIVRRFTPRIGEWKTALVGMTFGMLGIILMAQGHSQAMFYAGLAGMSIGIGTINPSLASLASRVSSIHEQGGSLGTFRSAGALARAFGPLSAAIIYWKFGSQVCYFIGATLLIWPFQKLIRLRKITL